VNSHKNARLGFTGRVCLVTRVVHDGWSGAQAAEAFGVSARTVWKWVARYRTEGQAGLWDRSARPHRSPRQLKPALVRRVVALRRKRRSGPQIADQLGLPLATVGDVLRRHGLGRLPPLHPRPPIVRYERERPGELLHIDAKTLGRIHPGVIGHRITGDRAVRGPRRRTGWECLHVAIDDASRVAYAELLPDESAASAVVFLEHAVTWLAHLGVRVERVMTDNAFCYTQRQYAAALATLGIQHRRTRPYTPRTNGKAERFIQTALREWAYAKPYRSSRSRAGALGPFLASYNTTRPHTAHGRLPPISRLATCEQPVR
jgi:transposase InsO family protein